MRGYIESLIVVIRQEWLASIPRIKKTSIAIAVIMLGAGVINVGAYLTHYGALTFFCMATYAAAFVCDAVIPFYALLTGSGNIRKMLFGESAPLMLLVPVRAAVILLGCQIVNLIEYLIYALSSFIYLVIMAPTSLFMWQAMSKNLFNAVYDVADYGACVKEFLYSVFVAERRGAIHITLLVIVAFLSVQATLNCAAAIYAAFVRGKPPLYRSPYNKENSNTEHERKPSRFIMVIILAALFYIPIRVGTLGIDGIVIERLDFVYRVWPYMARLALLSVMYFIFTAYLIERKIEVW